MNSSSGPHECIFERECYVAAFNDSDVVPGDEICDTCFQKYHLWWLRDLQNQKGVSEYMVNKGLKKWKTSDRRNGKYVCVADDACYEGRLINWPPAVMEAKETSGELFACASVESEHRLCQSCRRLARDSEYLDDGKVLFPCVSQVKEYDNAGWRVAAGMSANCHQKVKLPHAACEKCMVNVENHMSLGGGRHLYFHRSGLVRLKYREHRYGFLDFPSQDYFMN
jgi:hypothetical protein